MTIKIIDRRKISLGGHSKRSLSSIKNIAIHHSATTQGNTASFENHWKNANGWGTGGYHEVVLLNGDVELNYNADTISNGVGGQNTRMYNICYVGAGQPNANQLATLIKRVNYNRKRFGLSVNAVKGHREFSGQSTACPALNMSEFRQKLSNTGGLTVTQYKELKKLINAQDAKIKRLESELKKKENSASTKQKPSPSHAKNVKLAKQYGLFNGKDPFKHVPREQLATILINLINQFIRNDSKAEEYAIEALEWAKEHGISDISKPAHLASRQQVITITKRSHDLVKKEIDEMIREALNDFDK